MKKELKLFLSLIAGTAVYCNLMWYEDLGLNALIFAILLIAGIFFYKKEERQNRHLRFMAAMFLLSSIGVVITGLIFSKVIYYLSLFSFIGMAQMPKIRNLGISFPVSLINYIVGIPAVARLTTSFIPNRAEDNKEGNKQIRANLIIRIVIASFVFIIFFLLFSSANPQFNKLVENITTPIFDIWNKFWDVVSIWNILHFAITFYFLSLFFVKIKSFRINEFDADASDTYLRKRKKVFGYNLNLGLKNKYKTLMLTIILLNVLLLVVNITDLFSVWFGVIPDSPEELSAFVHKGTYTLIFSALLSICILLFFFYNNINAYPNNDRLKKISYVWLVQNIFMLLSVGLRNCHYISEYGLTYKRIGVFIFLIITCLGLVLMMLKIKNVKTTYYYIRFSMFGSLAVLVLCALVNWDVIIAKYNTTYISDTDYRYLTRLSEQTIPYRNTELYYGDEYEYALNVLNERNWRSFNLGDYLAAKKIIRLRNGS